MMQSEKKFSTISAVDKAKVVVGWLEEKQGGDILALDVRGINNVADAMVLVTAKSLPHAQALADCTLDGCGKENIEYLGMEGYKTGRWILVDLNDVVVHVLLNDVREFFNLEGLWSKAEVILRGGQDGNTRTSVLGDYAGAMAAAIPGDEESE